MASASPADAKFAEFRAWTNEAVKPGGKPGDFVARGVTLAKERRAALAQLIVDDPERALAEAVPPVVRQQLPAEIVGQLEDRVSTRGDFTVLATLPPEGSAARLPAIIRKLVTPDGTTYDAFVYGTRSRQVTATSLPVNGIALDGKLAVAESAARVVAAGEKIPASAPVVEVCPVSGATIPAARAETVPADADALEIGGTFHFFCGAGHLAEVQEGLKNGQFVIPGDSAPTPPGPIGESTYNQGTKKILIIRCNFTDALAEPDQRGGRAESAGGDGRVHERELVRDVARGPRQFARHARAWSRCRRPRRNMRPRTIPFRFLATRAPRRRQPGTTTSITTSNS